MAQPPLRSAAAVIPLLLVINLAARLFVALRPLELIDGLAIPDDAYLAPTIARNIARGLGPWVEPTRGIRPGAARWGGRCREFRR